MASQNEQHRWTRSATRPRMPAIACGWILAAGMALMLWGCASGKTAGEGRARLGPGDLVRVIPQEAGAPPNHHPVRLDPARIQTLLGALRHGAGGKPVLEGLGSDAPVHGDSIPVFTEGDLSSAAAALSLALATASPREDVALVLSQLRTSDVVGFLRASQVTGARVFHLDGELHLLFGAVDRDPARDSRAGVATPKTSAAPPVDRTLHFEADIGARGQPRDLAWRPVLAPGTRLAGTARNDWIALSTAPASEASGAGAAAPAAPASEPRTAAAEPPSDAQVVAARLTQLRNLREQGLIDEELYREKVRETLERYTDQPLQ